tara:strand:- start:3721 stop:5136 length:1416 start_codon:yes stop_codon:yes gene_type:complete
MNTQSRLTVLTRPWHANFTESNHLGQAFLAEPHKFDKVLTRVFTASRLADNPLTAMTKGMGRTSEIESFDWEWELMGASSRPLTAIVAAVGTGINNTAFTLTLDEDWFKPGDVISPNAGTERILVRIQSGPASSGGGFAYVCRLQSDDVVSALAVAQAAAGVQWSKMFSVYEEGGDQSGSTTYAMPMKLRSQLSTLRKEYSITGDAANQALVVALMDAEGKVYKDYKWLKYAEAEYWIQWHKEKERILWYGQMANNVAGANGRSARTGPGVQELLKDSHVHIYNTLTETLIREYLLDIFFGRVDMSNRNIVAYTGEYGMLAFHQAMSDASAPFLTVDSKFITGEGRDLAFGGQFVKYIGPNGITLTLRHNPLYDDREINHIVHPSLQVPVESMRFTFLDFGNAGGEANIKYVHKKNGYKLGYVSGLQTPYGPNKGGIMSNAKDAYTMIVHDQCGIQIDDVTRCGELILGLQ